MCNLEPFGFCMGESDLILKPSFVYQGINVTTQGRNYQLKTLSQVCLGMGPENKLNSFQIIKKV